MRQFFRDVQEWEWLPRRFDPTRALATPRSVNARIGPAPRVIADDVWAKLLWAGLHLAAADLGPSPRGGYGYPIELAAPVAIRTVRELTSRFAAIEVVTFCCFSAGDLAEYRRALA